MLPTLLTGDFVRKFQRRVDCAEKVQIASAWMTESAALNALLKRKNDCEAQAIIGIDGNATSPTSLSSFAKAFDWENLRLGAAPGLFHPKLFLFRRRGEPTVAWIGSANFTGHGMAANTELMLETDDKTAVAAMLKWFNEQWNALRAQNTEKAFKEYEVRWQEPGPNEADRGPRELHPIPPGTKIRFTPKGHAGRNIRGEIVYGAGDRDLYTSAAAGLRQVLVRLAQRREDAFLNACRDRPAFWKGEEYFVGKGRTEDEAVKRGKVYRKKRTVTPLLELEGTRWKWWMSEHSNTPDKWRMVKAAVEVANEEFKDGLLLDDQGDWPR